MTRLADRLRGFTLIELIVVVVILAIGAATVSLMVANVGRHQSGNRDFQVGTQLIQECAEFILTKHRREQTYFAGLATSANCYGMASFSGWSAAPAVTVADHTGLAGCPTSGTCKLVTITLSKSDMTLNSVNLILGQY
jgi:prepilin-type N-terminal cleavage/methylation domain-containing protein